MKERMELQQVTQEAKYLYFEDSYKMLAYVNEMNLLFKDNKELTTKIEIVPSRNQVRIEIIKNYIWVNQYFSMN